VEDVVAADPGLAEEEEEPVEELVVARLDPLVEINIEGLGVTS
jgi:hypothetical protein